MKRLDGKVECDFCHKFATLENAGKMGWDWFAGYNTLTTHICAQCLRRKPGDAKRLFDLSRVKPVHNA